MTSPLEDDLAVRLDAVDRMLKRDAPVLAAIAQVLRVTDVSLDGAAEELEAMSRRYRRGSDAIDEVRDDGALDETAREPIASLADEITRPLRDDES